MAKITVQDLEAIISQFDRSGWRELRLRMDGLELVLGKDANVRLSENTRTESAPPIESRSNARLVTPAEIVATPPAAIAHTPKEAAVPAGWFVVRAPSLGTFYRSPKPGTPPLAEVGAAVTADSEVCLIEVMKLFTTVRAGVKGTVREVYVKDAELVEFNQPMFLIEPNG